jgi:DNA-binding LacI/PurR family transcriptional regulator
MAKLWGCMKKHVTIKDIAIKAKLAKGTISMALNNDPRISADTRKRVNKIASEMNFYPNESAKNLASGKTGSIAFISPRFTSAYISTILASVEDKAFKTGKYLHGITPYSTGNNIAVKDELLRKMLYGRKADAVVLMTLRPTPEIVNEYKKKGIPFILVENDMPECNSICIDNVGGAYKATNYLIKKYGPAVGIIVGESDPPLGQDYHYTSMDRLKGYRQALSVNGIEFDRNRVQFVRHYSYDEGRECLNNFTKKHVKLDSLFCAAGDMLAMGVIDKAKKDGLRIPQDLPIIGYDDIQAARLLSPALTTVKQPFEEIGKLIYELAIDLIDGKIINEKHYLLESEIIIRETA